MEIFLLETSNHFGSTGLQRSKFDHRKSTFRTLAMLKTIADEYLYVSLIMFKRIIFPLFMAPKGSIDDFWLEDFLEIKPTIKVMELKKDHDSTLLESMFKTSNYLHSLFLTVNPLIFRLTEEEDKSNMTDLRP
ncbi:hypothetical protein INT48_006334 [Thamnidium elegans]|uniref:Uncharacterized protein n=1 Tax=Thamnidium elegans TaxID=101142 RepID=A0A8H7SM05_9FUNG|nr:hypothetical protein INT48_006334 [Thamnidium elegans]